MYVNVFKAREVSKRLLSRTAGSKGRRTTRSTCDVTSIVVSVSLQCRPFNRIPHIGILSAICFLSFVEDIWGNSDLSGISNLPSRSADRTIACPMIVLASLCRTMWSSTSVRAHWRVSLFESLSVRWYRKLCFQKQPFETFPRLVTTHSQQKEGQRQ